MESLQSIVHLDIARKYFSPQVLRTFADLLADNGIRQLELYFSDNQGFRFALDDMVFGKINLADALGDGLIDLNSGMRPDGSGRFLTENEMTEYIRYASERGLEIIPAFDMPAHMAAILRLVPSYCYRNSRTSLDITNREAVDFALAILERYLAYFAEQGCRSFNLVADEFALDAGGLERLENDGDWSAFLRFVRKAIAKIHASGMIPRVFNDAVRYHNDENNEIEKNVEVCYCIPSGGRAAHIAQRHQIINGSSDFFWVMGIPKWQVSADKIRSFDFTRFSDGTSARPSGVMLCFWCDRADAMTEEEFLIAAKPIIEVFGKRFRKATFESNNER